jgi:hypothetical protein
VPETLLNSYLSDALGEFQRLKKLADDSIAQVNQEEFFHTLDGESNSIAIVVKHIAGNLRSRWTEFLTSDGEKPDRDRDREFEIGAAETQETVLALWEEGWRLLFDAMDGLTPDDLDKTVMIRGEPHSVMKAIQRQLTHQAYHIGQIVLLAKHIKSSDWQTLSIPRGRSQEFNAQMSKRFASE